MNSIDVRALIQPGCRGGIEQAAAVDDDIIDQKKTNKQTNDAEVI